MVAVAKVGHRLERLKIFGIDPGSQVTGFCCLHEAYSLSLHPTVADAGVIRPTKTLSHSDSLGQIHDSIFAIIDSHSPDFAVIEKGFTGINQNSALRLGETRGAIIAAIRRNGCEVIEMAPNEVKKLVTGNGHAKKEDVSLSVELLLKFRRGKLPYDVTDAVAIAYAYSLKHKSSYSISKNDLNPNSKNLNRSKELS